jgi:hypothetical protein
VTIEATPQKARSAGKGAVTLASTAALILVVTAAFHATGYPAVVQGVAASSASSFVKAAAPKLWLFFSWHLIAVALGVLVTALSLRRAARPVLFACAIIVAVDLCWVLSIAGIFAGTVLLFIAVLCIVGAACLSPETVPEHAR